LKKKQQQINAYQLLLWDDTTISEEKRIWLSLCKLEEGQDKLRRTLFREIGELKKENTTLKQDLWAMKQSSGQTDLFENFMAMAN